MTVAALVSEAEAALGAAGVPSPDKDAERLLRHVLGWDCAFLLAHPSASVGPEDEARFRALVGARARRVPLQHLLGRQAFWKHDFVVTPDVLIPRPETELLIETALALLRRVERPVIVDVGTGSGCIALSLAFERGDASIHATDISEAALEVARENSRLLDLEPRVTFHRGDLLAPVARLAGSVHLVVSNPPYVDPADRDGLAPEVRDHDPSVALFPPGDLLGLYRRLAGDGCRILCPGGSLAVEVSPTVANAVAALLAGSGFGRVAIKRDLAGRPRVVHGRHTGAAGPPALK